MTVTPPPPPRDLRITTALMRSHANFIFEAAISAVKPEVVVSNCISRSGDQLTVHGQTFTINEFDRIVVVGAGKASAAMAAAVERILDDIIITGIIVTKYGHGVTLKKIVLREAGHPIPDEAGQEAAHAILNLLNSCGKRDLVIALISGGGSALLPLPPTEITLKQKQSLTNELLRCGATIQELNTVRKHFSIAKGGGLARAAHPATVINLMISDVMGDEMDIIAAGPFLPDSSTFSDALNILTHYNIIRKMPQNMSAYIKQGVSLESATQLIEPTFDHVHNFIIADNRMACLAAMRKAEELGYHTILLSSVIGGNTTDCALMHTAIAKEVLVSGNPIPTPACIISGGETTVEVKGIGKGGRNQEFSLVCAREIDGLAGNVVVLGGGTDGSDGPTDAAGGIVDTDTIERGKALGLVASDFLLNNDSYPYLNATGDLLISGPTRTNVMDIRIILVNSVNTALLGNT